MTWLKKETYVVGGNGRSFHHARGSKFLVA